MTNAIDPSAVAAIERPADWYEMSVAARLLLDDTADRMFVRKSDEWDTETYVLVCHALPAGWLVADWYGGRDNEALVFAHQADADLEFDRRITVECDEHGMATVEYRVAQRLASDAAKVLDLLDRRAS